MNSGAVVDVDLLQIAEGHRLLHLQPGDSSDQSSSNQFFRSGKLSLAIYLDVQFNVWVG